MFFRDTLRDLTFPHFMLIYVENLSIKIPPPVGESRFPVLAGARRVATSLSPRVILKGGVDAVGSCLKERRRRVSLNVFAVFVHHEGCALKPEN